MNLAIIFTKYMQVLLLLFHMHMKKNDNDFLFYLRYLLFTIIQESLELDENQENLRGFLDRVSILPEIITRIRRFSLKYKEHTDSVVLLHDVDRISRNPRKLIEGIRNVKVLELWSSSTFQVISFLYYLRK